MKRFLLDTSCMVAAVSAWHVAHAPTLGELNRRLTRGEALVSSGPALIEAYSVLTRLPSPHRLSPDDALALLEINFITKASVVSLNSDSYLRLLRGAPALGVYGGRSYDAVIAECAVQARVEALLTLNGSHFKGWESGRLKIVVPAP